ncbi:disease resistance protein RUN1-like [Prosopis cineraria]|uniref:disease resistance protein RUN1-like n=1 Tax=Prosopis cineraria TaxID=364024 RepID=UPI0024104018|nr:disease resistance protein RUN1-like [Prosopis cineraria]
MIEYARGLPLALKVLGSFFSVEKTISEWKDAMAKFKKIPPHDIMKILKVSFDGLEGDEKTIFLNIACFFNGMDKDIAMQISQNCDLHPKIGIKVIIYDKEVFQVHDMLQEMGKNIVFQESPNDVGKRNRIWSLEDASHVLENKVLRKLHVMT